MMLVYTVIIIFHDACVLALCPYIAMQSYIILIIRIIMNFQPYKYLYHVKTINFFKNL